MIFYYINSITDCRIVIQVENHYRELHNKKGIILKTKCHIKSKTFIMNAICIINTISLKYVTGTSTYKLCMILSFLCPLFLVFS